MSDNICAQYTVLMFSWKIYFVKYKNVYAQLGNYQMKKLETIERRQWFG